MLLDCGNNVIISRIQKILIYIQRFKKNWNLKFRMESVIVSESGGGILESSFHYYLFSCLPNFSGRTYVNKESQHEWCKREEEKIGGRDRKWGMKNVEEERIMIKRNAWVLVDT